MAGRADYTGAFAAFAVSVATLLVPIAPSAVADATVYRVDPSRTTAEYTVVYFGVLTQHGRFAATRGALSIDVAARSGHVEFTIDARSLDTGFPLRDAFVRDGMLLDVERHPSIAFASTHLAFTDDRLTRIDGRLTLRGVTRDVALDVQRFDCGSGNGDAPQECVAEATATLRRSDFGIDAYAPLIDDAVTLAFVVVGRR